MKVENKRLFIAIDIAGSVRDDLKKQVFKMGDFGRANWVQPENYHMTLKFLGDVNVHDIKTVTTIINEVAAKSEKTTLTYTEMGAFPNLSKPRALWIGFDDSTGVMKNIAQEIDKRLSKALGTMKERKEFKPHLTIARIKGEADSIKLSQFVKKGVNLRDNSFEVSKVTLYCSELHRNGAIYTQIAFADLK